MIEVKRIGGRRGAYRVVRDGRAVATAHIWPGSGWWVCVGGRWVRLGGTTVPELVEGLRAW